MDVFREMQVDIEDMFACGGGGSGSGRSSLWRQMLADMYNCPVSTVKADEGPAFGVAILAGVGAGIYDTVESACDSLVGKQIIQSPNTATKEQYLGYYKLYKKLYTDLVSMELGANFV